MQPYDDGLTNSSSASSQRPQKQQQDEQHRTFSQGSLATTICMMPNSPPQYPHSSDEFPPPISMATDMTNTTNNDNPLLRPSPSPLAPSSSSQVSAPTSAASSALVDGSGFAATMTPVPPQEQQQQQEQQHAPSDGCNSQVVSSASSSSGGGGNNNTLNPSSSSSPIPPPPPTHAILPSFLMRRRVNPISSSALGAATRGCSTLLVPVYSDIHSDGVSVTVETPRFADGCGGGIHTYPSDRTSSLGRASCSTDPTPSRKPSGVEVASTATKTIVAARPFCQDVPPPHQHHHEERSGCPFEFQTVDSHHCLLSAAPSPKADSADAFRGAHELNIAFSHDPQLDIIGGRASKSSGAGLSSLPHNVPSMLNITRNDNGGANATTHIHTGDGSALGLPHTHPYSTNFFDLYPCKNRFRNGWLEEDYQSHCTLELHRVLLVFVPLITIVDCIAIVLLWGFRFPPLCGAKAFVLVTQSSSSSSPPSSKLAWVWAASASGFLVSILAHVAAWMMLAAAMVAPNKNIHTSNNNSDGLRRGFPAAPLSSPLSPSPRTFTASSWMTRSTLKCIGHYCRRCCALVWSFVVAWLRSHHLRVVGPFSARLLMLIIVGSCALHCGGFVTAAAMLQSFLVAPSSSLTSNGENHSGTVIMLWTAWKRIPMELLFASWWVFMGHSILPSIPSSFCPPPISVVLALLLSTATYAAVHLIDMNLSGGGDIGGGVDRSVVGSVAVVYSCCIVCLLVRARFADVDRRQRFVLRTKCRLLAESVGNLDFDSIEWAHALPPSFGSSSPSSGRVWAALMRALWRTDDCAVNESIVSMVESLVELKAFIPDAIKDGGGGAGGAGSGGLRVERRGGAVAESFALQGLMVLPIHQQLSSSSSGPTKQQRAGSPEWRVTSMSGSRLSSAHHRTADADDGSQAGEDVGMGFANATIIPFTHSFDDGGDEDDNNKVCGGSKTGRVMRSTMTEGSHHQHRLAAPSDGQTTVLTSMGQNPMLRLTRPSNDPDRMPDPAFFIEKQCPTSATTNADTDVGTPKRPRLCQKPSFASLLSSAPVSPVIAPLPAVSETGAMGGGRAAHQRHHPPLPRGNSGGSDLTYCAGSDPVGGEAGDGGRCRRHNSKTSRCSAASGSGEYSGKYGSGTSGGPNRRESWMSSLNRSSMRSIGSNDPKEGSFKGDPGSRRNSRRQQHQQSSEALAVPSSYPSRPASRTRLGLAGPGFVSREATVMTISLSHLDHLLTMPSMASLNLLAGLLPAYYSLVARIVKQHRGTIQSAFPASHGRTAEIVCTWNVAQSQATHASAACSCALDLQVAFAELFRPHHHQPPSSPFIDARQHLLTMKRPRRRRGGVVHHHYPDDDDNDNTRNSSHGQNPNSLVDDHHLCRPVPHYGHHEQLTGNPLSQRPHNCHLGSGNRLTPPSHTNESELCNAGERMVQLQPLQQEDDQHQQRSANPSSPRTTKPQRSQLSQQPPPLQLWIGIDSGPVTFGHVVTETQRSFHVMGAPVAVGTLLSEFNGHLGTSILASHRVQTVAAPFFRMRIVDRLQFTHTNVHRPKSSSSAEPVCEVYELISRHEHGDDEWMYQLNGLAERAKTDLFEQGFRQLAMGNSMNAAISLHEHRVQHPSDAQAARILRMMNQMGPSPANNTVEIQPSGGEDNQQHQQQHLTTTSSAAEKLQTNSIATATTTYVRRVGPGWQIFDGEQQDDDDDEEEEGEEDQPVLNCNTTHTDDDEDGKQENRLDSQ